MPLLTRPSPPETPSRPARKHPPAGRSRPARRLLRAAGILLLALALAVGGLALTVQLTPALTVRLLLPLFSGEPEPVSAYAEAAARVTAVSDQTFPSAYGNNRFDVFYPAGAASPLPTLLWVHGGGFIGGDKSGVNRWATQMAAEGYAVVSMNYALPPDAHYPAPVAQMGELCAFLLAQGAARFPVVDMARLAVGGDSAGAQIASQFLAVQANPATAAGTGLSPVEGLPAPRAALLFCGPYDLDGLSAADSAAVRFLVGQVGWAYFGSKHWRDDPAVRCAATVEQVTADYPPVFLTDGNTGSFEPQARLLEQALRAKGVRVESLYFPLSEGSVAHEYQFDFTKPQADVCFDRTLDFLDSVLSQPAA